MTGRIRSLKPEWLDDEILAAASDEARVLSVALVLMADDYGRGRAALATIAAGAWRYQLERDDGAHAPDILARASRALRELSEMRFVVLYEVDRQRYFAIRNWTKHQRVDKPSKPRIPAPPEQETQENPPPREDPTRPSRDTRESFARGQESLAPDLRPPTSDQGARTEPKALTLVRGTVVDGQPLGDWLRAGVAKGYESLKLPAPKETKQITWPKWRELEAWVIEKDRLTGKGDQRETGRQLIRCFLRSPRAAKLGYPITFLVANANEYWRDTLPPALEAAS